MYRKVAGLYLKQVLASDVLRKAPKSIAQSKPELVSISGLGRVWVEPTDGEDTFPPAIASYAFRDGWLVYEGRRGEEGAVYGSAQELSEWMRQIDYLTKDKESATPREWKPSDGGAKKKEKAVATATSVLRRLGQSAEIRVMVDPQTNEAHGNASGSTLVLFNVHKATGSQSYTGNIRAPQHLHVAAHEAAHIGWSRSKASQLLEVLEDRERAGQPFLTTYHALSGHFEGSMEAAALYTLRPREMERKLPAVYEAVRQWFG